jgi:peptidoglycan/LPS O-acetylase OafA/YrhL
MLNSRVKFLYRPEIDGLRAVSVVLVCLFHAGVPGFSGGFIGVDVFLVISGYLITSLIVDDLKGQRFSILQFYEKRARRILPVLFTVVLVCVPFAYFWMLPEDYSLFLKSLVGVFLFSSNIVFFRSVDYFNPTAEEQPLLHTWSLGVEEQFYFFFPLLLMGLYRNRSLLFLVILGTVVLSFSLSQSFSARWPAFNFYMLPTRFWELGVGALLALWLPAKSINNFSLFLRLTFNVLGLAFIITGAVIYDSSTPFPGFYALLPVLGSVLLIVFAKSTSPDFVSRLLSLRPLVALGLLSYSLYLWHQPVLAFGKLRLLDAPSWKFNALLLILSLLLATGSYFLVERPCRYSKIFQGRKALTWSVCAILMGLSYPAYSLMGNAALNGRYSPQVVWLSNSSNFDNPDLEKCRGNRVGSHCVYPPLLARDFSGKIAVWGDSHADQLMPMFVDIGKELGFSVLEFSFPGCPPIPGIRRLDVAGVDCSQNKKALEFLLKDQTVKIVILHAYWQHYIDDENAFIENADIYSETHKVIQALSEAGKTIVLIGPVPKHPTNPRLVVAKSKHFGYEFRPQLTIQDHMANTIVSRSLLADFERSFASVSLFDPSAYLCKAIVCAVTFDGQMLYRDSNHLASQASVLLMQPLKQLIRKISRDG